MPGEKWPDQTLDQAFGLPEVLVAASTSRLSCKRAGKTRTLMPVWDSSGESRPQCFALGCMNILVTVGRGCANMASRLPTAITIRSVRSS